ncbi:MAG: hypothetical protein RL498_620, partial [Pseudomonadota bacterium]
VKPEIITKHDTIVKVEKITKYRKGDSIPFVVLDTIVKIEYDTIRIMSDYNRIYAYYDTLKLDSAQYVYVSDTISQNKILGRGYGGHFVQKEIRIETTKIMPPKFAVYWGVLGDYREFDKKVGFGFGLAFKMPKNGLFTLGATTNQYSIGIYKKL